ncbi:MAG: hypothetical protein QOK49_2614, partial [Baekduia sp.]|nr:hypothetical protein [Baekduia sp.]
AGTTDARVAGPLAALVPLVAGGAGRRLPGVQIQGRRHLRRLLKARRAPLGLADLAAAGIAPSPGLLLTVLARAVDPRWTARREPLAVEVASEGSDRWRVVASGDGPLAIVPAGAGGPQATAVLHTSAHRLAAVLAGTAAPGEAYVEGDVRDVRTLLTWLDRAQRRRP